jgi:hypothetical protein
MGTEEVVAGIVGPVAAFSGRSLRWLRPFNVPKAPARGMGDGGEGF